ncbi:hypothetical protein PACTADRAFT_48164 [Pachysolen tannophilus NRRL Y-2460]|uniref:INO2 bHLH domain-containing protein n=1 Tax=Pachysolen tannophilus NRRL Y-2460 TaxID=669874 RepID=A0A1E4U307_PACTA|nr:hypothetical protein PACTADRAFT_48164 [Pachysolen tannophilus NRRL Y-2460]
MSDLNNFFPGYGNNGSNIGASTNDIGINNGSKGINGKNGIKCIGTQASSVDSYINVSSTSSLSLSDYSGNQQARQQLASCSSLASSLAPSVQATSRSLAGVDVDNKANTNTNFMGNIMGLSATSTGNELAAVNIDGLFDVDGIDFETAYKMITNDLDSSKVGTGPVVSNLNSLGSLSKMSNLKMANTNVGSSASLNLLDSTSNIYEKKEKANSSTNKNNNITANYGNQIFANNDLRPITPEPLLDLHSYNDQENLAYKSPNTLSSERLLQEHRNAIIEAGLKAHNQHQGMNANSYEPNTRFAVSPNTRNILNSINNFNSMNKNFNFNNSGYELLSLTESSALENFLDSVVDETKLSNLEKHWSSIDPLASESLSASKREQSQPTNAINNCLLPGLQTDTTTVGNNLIKNEDINSNLPLPFLRGTTTNTNRITDSGENYYNSDIKEQIKKEYVESASDSQPQVKKRGRKKKIENSNSSLAQSSLSPSLSCDSKRMKKSPAASDQKKSHRKILSEDERKFNHTESEKRRRAMIKQSYDALLETIKAENCYSKKRSCSGKDENKKSKSKAKKSNSKYAVMSTVIEEIEWLVDVNNKLKNKV